MSDHILIVFFSHYGNTQRIADLIHELTGGTILRIEAERPYPDAYNAVIDQAKHEIHEGFKPSIIPSQVDLDPYTTIFIGSPNWWSTIAPPVATFLEANDLSDKVIVPFCTHGGGGLRNVEKDIRRLCPKSTFLESLAISGSSEADAQTMITAWIHRIGL